MRVNHKIAHSFYVYLGLASAEPIQTGNHFPRLQEQFSPQVTKRRHIKMANIKNYIRTSYI